MARYSYKIHGERFDSSRKIYKQNGVYGYRKGDFFEPVGPNLMFRISMAQLNELTKEEEDVLRE